MSKNKTDEVVFFQSATMVGVQFMEIMDDYMKRQESPTFHGQDSLYDLYEDLSNLYNDNMQ